MRLARIIILLALFHTASAQAQTPSGFEFICKTCIKTDPVLRGFEIKNGVPIEVRPTKNGIIQFTVNYVVVAQGIASPLSMIAVKTDPVLSQAQTLVAGYDQLSGNAISLRQDRKGNFLILNGNQAAILSAAIEVEY